MRPKKKSAIILLYETRRRHLFIDISDFIEVAKGFHVLGIKITKDGELINEWHSEAECRRNIYSATKSFTSCAVGFAVQEGLISLDEKLIDAFSEDLPDVTWFHILPQDFLHISG